MIKNIFNCALVILLLSACGWHLHGSINMPTQLNNLYISATNAKGAQITDLRQLLKTHHISLTEDETNANYSLNILEESKVRRTAGVGGDALSSSYEITLKAHYEIRMKNSAEKTKGDAISVRSFNYNTASINSATQEELILDGEMRRDLSQQMLRHLSAVIVNEKSPNSEAAHGKTAPWTTERCAQ